MVAAEIGGSTATQGENMLELPSLRPETRYGMPAADQIMFNRYFVIGYSYYFRQAKWALEIVDPILWTDPDDVVARSENFRPDYRVPPIFRAPTWMSLTGRKLAGTPSWRCVSTSGLEKSSNRSSIRAD